MVGRVAMTSELVDGISERMGVWIWCGCVGCCGVDDEWWSFLQTASLVMEGGRRQSRASCHHSLEALNQAGFSAVQSAPFRHVKM